MQYNIVLIHSTVELKNMEHGINTSRPRKSINFAQAIIRTNDG